MLRLTTVVLVIVLPLFIATSVSQRRDDQRPVLWRTFEEALVNSDGMLYNLSNTFFPPDGSAVSVFVSVMVGVTVDRINDSNFAPFYVNSTAGLCCSTDMGYCTVWVNCRDIVLPLEQPRTDNGAAQITNLLAGPDINMVLTAFDPAFYYLMKKLSDERLDLITLFDVQEITTINFHVNELAVMPSESEMYDAVSAVLTWAKAYARAHGLPYERHERDRYAVVSPTDSVHNQYDNMLISYASTSMLLLCAFILTNLLVLMVAIMFFDGIFLWLQSGDKSRAVYIASGVVLAIFNHITFVCEIIVLNQFIMKPTISVYYFAVKLPLMVLIFTVEIIAVSYNTYKHRPMKCLYWIAHSFASCHILWFFHRLVTDTIISITSFIIAPAQTLGVLTLILSTVACIILFVAYVIHKGINSCNRRTCLPLFGAIVVGIATCGLVFIFTLLFIALADNGLKSAGIGGFLLSLIPPSIIFVASLLVEWKLSISYLPHYGSRIHDSNSDCKRSKGERTSSRHKTHLLSSAVSVHIPSDDENTKESVISHSPNIVSENSPLLN